MKYLFIAALLFSATASAQSDSTIKSAIQIQPVVVNVMTKDTATQVTWQVFDLSRDTTKGCNSYVSLYNRIGNNVFALNVAIPASVVNKWGTDDKVIDDYILTFLGLKRK